MALDPPSQDGDLLPHSSKKAAQCLLARTSAKDASLPSQGEILTWVFDPADLNVSLLQLPEQDASSPVSTQSIVVNMGLTVQHDSSQPEPTLREILLAVNTCNSFIADIAGEVKGLKWKYYRCGRICRN